jgi:acetyl-CoA C-acetyltransferase
LRDVARRAALGLDVNEHRRSLGELFAPMSAVAATNPHAWFPKAWSPDELIEPSADNRMVAFPYTKRLVAVMDVDLSAAVVVASADAADRLGVPEDERVHLRGWAYATDPVYVAEHDDLARSPAMAWAFEQALSSAGATLDDVDVADLYSCFPSSVLMALDALGIAPDHRLAPFTVTGGLPYAGGAGSTYLLSSIAAMADRLRHGEARDDGGRVGDRVDGRDDGRVDDRDDGSRPLLGLVSGVGMHLTKHAVAVLGRDGGDVHPPPPDPGPAVTRPIIDVHRGSATVAAYTVHHGRDGVATDAILVCDVPGASGGGRCYAATRDPEWLGALESEEWVGRPVTLGDGGDGVNLLQVERVP